MDSAKKRKIVNIMNRIMEAEGIKIFGRVSNRVRRNLHKHENLALKMISFMRGQKLIENKIKDKKAKKEANRIKKQEREFKKLKAKLNKLKERIRRSNNKELIRRAGGTI